MDVFQGKKALLRQVKQASRGGNKHIAALFELFYLGRIFFTANYGKRTELGGLRDGASAFGNLLSQFACRRQNQRVGALSGSL